MIDGDFYIMLTVSWSRTAWNHNDTNLRRCRRVLYDNDISVESGPTNFVRYRTSNTFIGINRIFPIPKLSPLENPGYVTG